MLEEVTRIPLLPPRQRDTHKGTFGKVLVVAGSLGMSGAAVLVGRSVLRTGSGLARVAVPRSILPIVAAAEPCITTIPLPEHADGCISAEAIGLVLGAAEHNQAVAVGPGLGQSPGCRQLVQALIGRAGMRIVLDADGLTSLAGLPGWEKQVRARLILTPHPKEMLWLWRSVSRKEPPAERREWAAELAGVGRCVVVLKGHRTVVSDGKRIYVNETGNPGMATGGTGDVLTGVIASLAGQGFDDFEAAVLGVYVHGLAGDIAAERLGQAGMIATDVIEALPQALQRVQGGEKP